MKDLIKDVLSRGDFGLYQASALLLFVGLLTAVMVWIYLPGSKSYYQRIADDVIKGDKP